MVLTAEMTLQYCCWLIGLTNVCVCQTLCKCFLTCSSNSDWTLIRGIVGHSFGWTESFPVVWINRSTSNCLFIQWVPAVVQCSTSTEGFCLLCSHWGHQADLAILHLQNNVNYEHLNKSIISESCASCFLWCRIDSQWNLSWLPYELTRCTVRIACEQFVCLT